MLNRVSSTESSRAAQTAQVFTWGYCHRSKGEFRVNQKSQGPVFSHTFWAEKTVCKPLEKGVNFCAHVKRLDMKHLLTFL